MRLHTLFLSFLFFRFVGVSGQVTWGSTEHEGRPWVSSPSRPYDIERGLDGRHIAVWASHGRYYDNAEDKWKWQRPSLFCTTEDLFTQTIVVPFLIPMLENAGAVVFTPRERDWQRNEVIVDNDDVATSFIYNYIEYEHRYSWVDAPFRGFATPRGWVGSKAAEAGGAPPFPRLHEGDNPFAMGTARQCETTHRESRQSTVSYRPSLPEEGRYAVYVSYQTLPQSVDDAHYTVFHRGERTDFIVNQQMGGGTWVYLGSFDFDAGCSDDNCVMLSNLSETKGVVTTDAVRFGGGMGNVERGGRTSGLARSFEGARYWAQWAGMPQSVYSSKHGENDYADDINARSLMVNELCGGSVYAPDSAGRRVPIELSLAVHSDAGHTDTGLGVYGSLAICTTQKGDSLLAAGKSRQMSYDLASNLLDNVTAELRRTFGEWEARALYDRNYSETRLPIVPSAILETLSHQNFGDMRYAQDPMFRFTMARAIYKSLLAYVNSRHGRPWTVQPLPPDNFHIEPTAKRGEVRISWRGIADGEGSTLSTPTGYVIYMAIGDRGYDNGTLLRGSSCNVVLKPGVLHRFRVAAVNDGGRSFPTEELTAYYDPDATRTILVVNGFHRLSSPAIAGSGQGFDLQEDIGVSYGTTAGWIGLQRVFDEKRIGIADSTGLGFSTNELEGRFIAGNTFDYVRTHSEAILRAFPPASGGPSNGRGLNIVSASAQAVERGEVQLSDYAAVDLILGLERNDGHSLMPYKTFTPALQQQLRDYAGGGGRLLVSGAYVASDMTAPGDKDFLADVLHVRLDGTNSDTLSTVGGLGMTFRFHRQPCEAHYHAHHADVLMPAEGNDGGTAAPARPFPAMVYASGTSAAVACAGTAARTFTMGFPLETITEAEARSKVMYGVLNFLLE